MFKLLWRFTPILLMLAALWWGADRLVPAMQAPLQGLADGREARIEGVASRETPGGDPSLIPDLDTEAMAEELLKPPAFTRFASAKDLVILAVVVIGAVWLVKWVRHRSLLSYLRRAAEHKQALERAIQHQAHKATSDRSVAATPRASPSPPVQEKAVSPRQRDEAPPEPPPKALAQANTLLVSHLSTELALRGVKTSPDSTARLLAKAQDSLLRRVRYLDDDPHKIAATLGTEVRRLLTGDPKYLTDPQWQLVADALVEVLKVIDRGPDFQWACDTVEGFVMAIEDLEQVEQKTQSFASQHGPMGKLFGAVTSSFRKIPPPLPGEKD